MKRQAMSDKILVLGVDGMDPALTKRFVEEGIMPNVKKYLERGVAREDLVMQGGHPTITPPMWTTMATGTCPGTHGITCFWNPDPERLDTLSYALDSRKCKSEPLWNVFAEAGKKTLVWQWPGSSWPPTSNNPNLYVVDGTTPGFVGTGAAVIDWEKVIVADKDFGEVLYKPRIQVSNGAGCVLTDVDAAEDEPETNGVSAGIAGGASSGGVTNIELSEADGELGLDDTPIDIVNSPIKPAAGWAEAPADALEFTVVLENGFSSRPALILKNAEGVYDHIAIYKNKKAAEPIVTAALAEPLKYFVDKVADKDGEKVDCARFIKVAELKEDGSHVKLHIGMAANSFDKSVWHPHSFNDEIIENVGLLPSIPCHGSQHPDSAEYLMIADWEKICDYQAKALNYCAEEGGFEVIYSHIHNVDHMGHKFWHHAKPRANTPEGLKRAEDYQNCIREVYKQTDRYLGQFLHLLDEDWSIFIMSDHGLMVMEEEHPPLIGDAFGCNVRVLQELGFTALKKDENGNDMKEIDWEHTKAVATRGGQIYINLKGRNPHGIVEPEDKYQVEEDLIKALYHYEYQGKRAISLALRNKDAKVLGMYGPECGDVVYFLAEGFNRLHGDSLATTNGYWGTSVSPIVIFAGKGFKKGAKINRIIQQVDFAATIAAIGGVRMPRDCEGAPVYPAFEEEF